MPLDLAENKPKTWRACWFMPVRLALAGRPARITGRIDAEFGREYGSRGSLDLAKPRGNNIDMTLSKEERDAIEQSGAVTLTVDGIRCVVLRADVYSALTNDLDHDELRAMLARSTQNGDWLDPSMDIYDDYDKHR